MFPLIDLPKIDSARPFFVLSIYACRQVDLLCLYCFRNPVSDDAFAGSRAVTEWRFDFLVWILLANSILRNSHISFMSEYKTLGHMSVVEFSGTYYIPHHAVCRPDDDDAKIWDILTSLRVVIVDRPQIVVCWPDPNSNKISLTFLCVSGYINTRLLSIFVKRTGKFKFYQITASINMFYGEN